MAVRFLISYWFMMIFAAAVLISFSGMGFVIFITVLEEQYRKFSFVHCFSLILPVCILVYFERLFKNKMTNKYNK